MALSFEKLNASVARSADVSDKVLAHLAASQPDPAVEVANQASIDNAASALDVQSAKASAVLPPEAPKEEPAPAA